jgi:hypothetical protein
MTNICQDAARRLAAPFDAAAVRWKPMKVSGTRAPAEQSAGWEGRIPRLIPGSVRAGIAVRTTQHARPLLAGRGAWETWVRSTGPAW